MPAPSVPTLVVWDCSAVERGACRCREAFNVAPITFGDGVSTYYHSFAHLLHASPLLPVSQVHPRTPAAGVGADLDIKNIESIKTTTSRDAIEVRIPTPTPTSMDPLRAPPAELRLCSAGPP